MSKLKSSVGVLVSVATYIIAIGFFLYGARSLVTAGVAVHGGQAAGSSAVVGLLMTGFAGVLAAWFFRQVAAITWRFRGR